MHAAVRSTSTTPRDPHPHGMAYEATAEVELSSSKDVARHRHHRRGRSTGAATN
jgi:hypothetical protein